MFRRDRTYPLDAEVDGVLSARALLGRLDCAPRGMLPVSVLVDLDPARAGQAVRGLTVFFTRDGRKDAVCRFDNASGTLVCSRAYPSPPKPESWAPLDLPAVTVDVADAVAAVGRLAAVDVDAHPGSRSGVDALLHTVGGRPVWAVSYDVWAEGGPVAYRRLHVDAVTGEITAESSQP